MVAWRRKLVLTSPVRAAGKIQTRWQQVKQKNESDTDYVPLLSLSTSLTLSLPLSHLHINILSPLLTILHTHTFSISTRQDIHLSLK